MPSLLVKRVDESLMRAMNAESARQGMTLRDWVIWVISVNVGWETAKGPLPEIQRGSNVDGREAGKLEMGSEKARTGQGGSTDETGDVADAAGNEHGCSVVESPVADVPDLEVEVDEAPFVDEQEIEEVKPPDCPYCDHVLMLWMRPGPNKGKWACAECDKAFTVEGLRRLGK